MFDISDPEDSYALIHHTPLKDPRKRLALRLVKFMRIFADRFFAKRYDHRAVVHETAAAVPCMVGGMLQHLKALRTIRDDDGWVRELLDEAEIERVHLMTFIKVAEPNRMKRYLILLGHGPRHVL